ncbi:MAG TPA: hypothetical protein PLL95_05040 [Anaerolineales bacterium]|nr:hypothetical protein [Anaerolineales bacterium]
MKVTKTFTITATPQMMLKIERFLAWMHFNTAWGHSATIALDCDGDGSDKVSVVENNVGIGILTETIQSHREYVYHMKSKNKSVEWIGG